MAPCRCLRHNMSTRRAGRSQTSCKSLRLAAAGQRGRKGWGTKPPWSSGAAPLSSPPRPGREPSGCQRPKRRFAATGWSTKPPRRYCSRHSHPRHQCGRSQVPPGRSARPGLHLPAARRGAGPVSTRPRRPGAGREHGDGTGGAGVIPIGLSIFCLACQGDAWMAEPCSASLGGRWSLPVLRPPSLHCQRSRARHLLGLPAAGMLLPFAEARGGCGNPCARAQEPLLAAAKGPRKEMLLACAQPSCRLWK